MFIIRKEQEQVFNENAFASYIKEMIQHCKEFSPELCATLNDDQLSIAIHKAIQRANMHDFTQRGPVRLFIEMILLFGSDFYSDPQYPWIREIIKNNKDYTQIPVAEELYEKILDYQEMVNGPDDNITIRAYERIKEISKEPPVFPQDDFITNTIQVIQFIYPEKFEYVGADALLKLFNDGIETAKAHGLNSGRSWLLICLLKFTFGHGCTDDPLYPWINETLHDEKNTDPEHCANRLENKSLIWLDRVLTNFKNEDSYE